MTYDFRHRFQAFTTAIVHSRIQITGEEVNMLTADTDRLISVSEIYFVATGITKRNDKKDANGASIISCNV